MITRGVKMGVIDKYMQLRDKEVEIAILTNSET